LAASLKLVVLKKSELAIVIVFRTVGFFEISISENIFYFRHSACPLKRVGKHLFHLHMELP
jgi:hypothetical protein